MRVDEAIDFILPALPRAVGNGAATWADVGAGDGTFTRALSRYLGEAGTIHAIDRDHAAMQRLSAAPQAPQASHESRSATIVTHTGNVADDASWRGLALPPLNGILIANTLHFVPNAGQSAVLERLASSLAHEGRLLVIEYEHRAANRWVPYPIAFEELSAILPVTLLQPVKVASRPSAFGGSMYLSLMRKA
jgi:phospholipid N-methyltransferase